MIWQILTQIGLEEKEAKVYLSLLELGSQPVSTIAKKAGIPRTTAYEILDRLMQKGLINRFEKAKVTYFTAQEPQALFRYLSSKRTDIESQEKFLEGEISKLYEIDSKTSIKPRVAFFEGLEGIKAVYEDTLTADGEILAFNNINAYPEGLSEYIWNKYMPSRAEKKILKKVLGTKHNNKSAKQNKKEYRIIKVIPNQFKIDIEINIYNNKIAFISYSNKQFIAAIIENGLIAESMKSIHRLIWSTVK